MLEFCVPDDVAMSLSGTVRVANMSVRKSVFLRYTINKWKTTERDVSLKPRPHQQQCRSNIVECYNVERCFDIVAQNGNIVEATGNKVTCCFDNVASTLLLVSTGLKGRSDRMRRRATRRRAENDSKI